MSKVPLGGYGVVNRLYPPNQLYDYVALLETGDFNEDGRPDFLGYGRDASYDGAWIWLSQGTYYTWYAAATRLPISAQDGFRQPRFADVNGDDHLDIVIPYYDLSPVERIELYVFVGDGKGNYATSSTPVLSLNGHRAETIQAFDSNNDGITDLSLIGGRPGGASTCGP